MTNGADPIYLDTRWIADPAYAPPDEADDDADAAYDAERLSPAGRAWMAVVVATGVAGLVGLAVGMLKIAGILK